MASVKLVTITSGVLALLGVIFCILGATVYIIFPDLMTSKIKQMFVLKKGSEVFDTWKEVPIPIYTKFYLFNITNPEEFQQGELPQLNEVGPFVYRQEIQKVIEFPDDEDQQNKTWTATNTLKVRFVKTYHFEPSMSPLPLNTTVNVLNIPLVGIGLKIKPYAIAILGIKFWGGLKILDKTKLVLETTAGNFLFDGEYQELFVEVKRYLNVMKIASDDVENLLQKFPEDNKFRLLDKKNGTASDGLFEIYSGEDDYKKFSVIHAWNEQTNLTYWKNDTCNSINGTDGKQFPPLVDRKQKMYVLVPDLCRSIHLEYDKDTTVEGIKGYRYTVPSDLLAAPTENPDNECFVTDPKMTNTSGVLDISTCREGVPLIISLPHFYMGSEELRKLEGLEPNQAKHETEMVVEPTTGTVIKAARRIQINMRVNPNNLIGYMRKVPKDLILPIMWLDEGAVIDDKIADKLYKKIYKPPIIANNVSIAFMIIGVLMAVGFATLCFVYRLKKGKGKMNYV